MENNQNNSNSSSNNNWVWVGVVILVVAVIFYFVYQSDNGVVDDADKATLNTNTNTQPNDETATTEPESTEDVDTKTPVVKAISISYADALTKYADRRIQLDKGCVAVPRSVTYKDNTGIMIDNRSGLTRTVKVGEKFTIKPWGFKIVVLPDTYLKNKTLLIDCDKSQNVATILVQE